MKRLAIALTVVAVLVVGTAVAVSAQTAGRLGGWGCPGWGGDGAGNGDPANSPVLGQLADKLGLTAKDLAAELEGGKSVAEVASARKVDTQALVDLLNAPRVEMMKIGVQYGYHTQEQADAMQKYMAEQIRYQLEQKGFSGWGYGMMGGPGGIQGTGMMGGFGGMMRGWQ